MFLEIIRQKSKELGYSIKDVATMANMSERTVKRIFTGETDNPYASHLHRIAVVLDLSLDDLLADGQSIVGGKKVVALTEENNALKAEVERLTSELVGANADIAVLKDTVATLSAKNDSLTERLAHKDEIIELHNFYMRRKSNE